VEWSARHLDPPTKEEACHLKAVQAHWRCLRTSSGCGFRLALSPKADDGWVANND